MSVYDPNEFIKLLKRHMARGLPSCPFCGGRNYTTTDSLATILITKDKSSIDIGPTVPSGMMICTQCGHIDFFSLGALGLMCDEGKQEDDKQTKEKAK